LLKIQTEWRGAIAPHLKLAIFHIVYEGPEEGRIDTGFSNILFAMGYSMTTGKPVKLRWEKGGPCILIGPIKEGRKGIIKVRVEGW